MSPHDASGFADRIWTAQNQIRRHGAWVLAFVAPLVSWKVWTLVASSESVKAAPRLALADMLLAALAMTLAAEIVVRRQDWRAAVVHFTAFLWIAVAILSAIGAGEDADHEASIKEIVQLAEIVLVAYGWMLCAARERRTRQYVLMALAAAASIQIVFAWGQIAAGASAFHIRGLYEHRNAYGMFVVVAAPLFVSAGLSGGRHVGLRVWYIALAALGVSSLSSGGLTVAAAAGILLVGFYHGRRHGAAALAAVAILCCLVQPVLTANVRAAQLKSLETFPKDENDRRAPSARVRRWQACLNAVAKHPTLGVGIGQFQNRIGEFYGSAFEKPHGRSDDVMGFDIRFDEPGSQSLYEVTAVEMGTLGILAVGAFLAAAAARLARSASGDSTGMAIGALGTICAVAVASACSSMMVRGVAIAFAIVLALGEAAARPEDASAATGT
jgi:O-antigen ligase